MEPPPDRQGLSTLAHILMRTAGHGFWPRTVAATQPESAGYLPFYFLIIRPFI